MQVQNFFRIQILKKNSYPMSIKTVLLFQICFEQKYLFVEILNCFGVNFV